MTDTAAPQSAGRPQGPAAAPPDGRHALIVGCGLAGPVLALFLQQAGIRATIYEGRPEPDDDAGYFLNVAPNGAAVLETLGIREEALGAGTPTTAIAFRNHRGETIGTLPEATTLIRRGRLNQGLRQAATRRGIAVEFGKRLTDIEVRPPGTVVARFADGTAAPGDFLIGCDGVHSRTRRTILPQAPRPRYTGLIDSGGFADVPSLPPSAGVFSMTFGTRGFFGYQKVPSGEVFWFENHAQPVEPDRAALDAIPEAEYRRRLLDLHRDDHPPIAAIIAATERRIGRYPNYDIPSLPAWHKGPVCLIGDAAHAALPSAGQGASLAFEDAIVLAKCLRDVPDVPLAFATFESLRRARVEAVVAQARRTSGQKGPTNALSRAVRDLLLPFFLKLAAGQARRGHAFRVDWEERVTPVARLPAAGAAVRA